MGGGVRPPEYFRTLRGRALAATNLLTDEESAIKELVAREGPRRELLVPAVHRRDRRDLQRARRRHVPEPGRRARPPGARGRDVRQAGRRVGLARRRRVLLPGETGFLLDDASPSAIAAALRELIADPELRTRLGEARARARARALRPGPERARGRSGLRRAARASSPSRQPRRRVAERVSASRCAASAGCRRASGGRPRSRRSPRWPRRSTHRGPDGDGSFARRRRRARLPPARDHRPERRGHAAVRERRRRAAAPAQRRDLQLPRAAPRARGARPPLPLADRHRGDRRAPTRSGATTASSASTACGRSRSGTAASGGSSARATASG